MNKITNKIVVLFSSLFLTVNAFAGELAVTGSANASYVVNGGSTNNNDKGLGISNELKFAASGELDNGYTWSYFMELDGNDGGDGGGAKDSLWDIKLEGRQNDNRIFTSPAASDVDGDGLLDFIIVGAVFSGDLGDLTLKSCVIIITV